MLNCRNCCKRRLTKISDLNGKKNWSTLITTTSGASDLFQWFTSSSKPLNVSFCSELDDLHRGSAPKRLCIAWLRPKNCALIYIIHCSVKNSLHPDANFFLYNIVANDTQSSDSDHRLCFSSRHLSQHSLLPFLLGLFSSQIYTTSWPHSTQYIRTVILLEMLDHIIDRPNHHSHHQI